MIYKHLCVLELWTKVASALEGLTNSAIFRPDPGHSAVLGLTSTIRYEVPFVIRALMAL